MGCICSMSNKRIYFTDPDDITGQRMIYLEAFLEKVGKKNLTGNPFFFDGVVIEKDDKETFDYILTKEEVSDLK